MIYLWILCGTIAAGWLLKEEFDIHNALTISDLLIAAVLFALGPIVLTVGVIATVWDWLDKNGSKVIIKRKKYDI